MKRPFPLLLLFLILITGLGGVPPPGTVLLKNTNCEGLPGYGLLPKRFGKGHRLARELPAPAGDLDGTGRDRKRAIGIRQEY